MKSKTKAEFGDFQTPLGLAREVCAAVAAAGFRPASVVEPTCGRGSFLQAAVETFQDAREILGAERNAEYVEEALARVGRMGFAGRIRVVQRDFFQTDWASLVRGLPKPILVLGNPPWVTNSALSTLGSLNLPDKSNHDNLRGIDALTGKSNFDISEWMLRQNVDWLANTPGMLAVLCKTAVARKVLAYAWRRQVPVRRAELRRVDAQLHFGASVDACLLVVDCLPGGRSTDCEVYKSMCAAEPEAVIGLRRGHLVADVHAFERWQGLLGAGLGGWRSGIKHDCSRVFELVATDTGYLNGLGMEVDVEDEVLYPLLKSSDLASNRPPRKMLLVPHKTMTASPEVIRRSTPKAWEYLLANAPLLAKRGSSIHRGRPSCSLFGVGEYSFAPWKVAISGLYKTLDFVKVSPAGGKPVVLDDTCYFFPCASEEECEALHRLVHSRPAQELWSALVFWDAKRPVTAQLLNSLDFAAVADATGIHSRLVRTLSERQLVPYMEGAHQQLLFRDAPARADHSVASVAGIDASMPGWVPRATAAPRIKPPRGTAGKLSGSTTKVANVRERTRQGMTPRPAQSEDSAS